MTRFLATWACLATVLAVVGSATELLLFRRLDLRQEALLLLLTVPTFQAVVLTWVARRPGPGRLGVAVRQLAGQPALLALLAADLVALATGWASAAGSAASLAGDAPLQVAWLGAKAAATGVVLTVAAARDPERRAPSIVALALLAAALGSAAFAPWLSRLPAVLLPGRPTLVGWLVIFGGVFVAAVALLLMAARELEARAPVAATLLEAAVAAGFLAALVAVPGYFARPVLVSPWQEAVRTCLSLAATWSLLAALVTERRGGAPARF